MGLYTQDAVQRCLGLIDHDIDTIWDDIDSAPNDTTSDKWKKKILKIVKEYTFSSRFALMRILLNRANKNCLIDEKDPSKGYIVQSQNGITYRFFDVTIDHAQNLTEDEERAYEEFLMEIASLQSDADIKRDQLLVHKALVPVAKKTTLLTREEAFQLGHSLQFTIDEMNWFLLRVFEIEGGFRHKSSNDLIEAYAFLRFLSVVQTDNLKKKYYTKRTSTADASPDESEADWTLNIGDSLQGLVSKWETDSIDTIDDVFLDWLEGISVNLDRHSQTALRIYRNLIVYAFDLINGADAPNADVKKRNHQLGTPQTEFRNKIREKLSLPKISDKALAELFSNGEIDSGRCRSIAKEICSFNADALFFNQTNKEKAFAVPMITKKGTPRMTDTLITKPNDIGKTTKSGKLLKTISCDRISEILTDKLSVEKHDILYVIWLISYICWFNGNPDPSPEEIKTRLTDFCGVAEDCLESAGLPHFYPPHLMEQSMLLSIACSYANSESVVPDGEIIENPEEVYGMICDYVRQLQEGKKKKKNENKK